MTEPPRRLMPYVIVAIVVAAAIVIYVVTRSLGDPEGSFRYPVQ